MRSDDGRCRRYAVRRLNPFAGVLQVLETGNARAYSPDGYRWQVQVLARRPDHTWRSAGDGSPVEQFFNFGLWDAGAGLHRVPANPVMDIGAMLAAADALVDRLTGVRERLPFPLVDRYECWSIDADGRVVALLAATEARARVRDVRVTDWRAAETRADRGAGPWPQAASLEAQVRRRGAGCVWYERQADGSGSRIGSADVPVVLPAGDFPELGLTREWADDAERSLAEDYFSRLAPRLLLLQRIGRERRAWLEREASRRATELAAVQRLLPEVIDRERVEAARVEARLRQAGSTPAR
jgi:hypothetical protein